MDMAVYRKSFPYDGWNHPASRFKVSLNFTPEEDSAIHWVGGWLGLELFWICYVHRNISSCQVCTGKVHGYSLDG
jgi:hypothetical protein